MLAPEHDRYLLANGTAVPTSEMERHALLLRARFLSNIRFDSESGCWIWRLKPGANGYGAFCVAGKNRRAHRWAYEHFVEQQPEALVIDHLCRNRLCVNPDHLEPVLQRINVLRGNAPAALRARQTHCIHGHELSGTNLYYKSNGSRECVICRRDIQRRRGKRANR